MKRRRNEPVEAIKAYDAAAALRPHFGRIGAQPEHAKPCPITADAQRAVAEAQHARKAKTIKHGARATVR